MGARKGAGSIYRRKDTGRWCAQLDLGVDEQGARIVWRYTAPADCADPKADAKAKLARAVYEHSRGTALVRDAQTVGEYLTYWLRESVEPNRAPRTLESYEAAIRLHVAPYVGSVGVRQLSAQHLVSLFGTLRREGVGSRAQVLTFAVLHSAFHQALRWGVVDSNPLDRIDKPKHRTAEKPTLDSAQVGVLLRAARGDHLEAFWTLAVALGLRRGELLGLRWADVDLDRGLIHSAYQLQRVGGEHVLREHKTTRSKRTLPLAPLVIAALKQHRARQNAVRLRRGEGWRDRLGLVFTTDLGSPLDGSVVSHRFKELVQAAQLPDLDLHDLRHTAGSLLASIGTPAAVIRDLLGHSQLSTTDRYLHSLPEQHRTALDGLGALLDGQQEGHF